MEPSIINWPCYEPAGYSVTLTAAELGQHVLVVGSTGSGKTTLLTSATRQLIAHDAGSAAQKIGLLLLDAKVDGLVEQVQADARAAGREHDVLVFGPDGNYAFDLFGGLRSQEDVERITRRIMLGTEPLGDQNAYWQQATVAMVSAALALLVASNQPIHFEGAVEFMRRWFLAPATPPEIGSLASRLGGPGKKLDAGLLTAIDQVKFWQNLDPRTRSNIQSCLLHVLRPLVSPSATRCFSPNLRLKSSPALAATEGKLSLISCSALSEPDLAKFFFRLAKQEFFDAVQQRKGRAARLTGLIADEFPLVVTREDVDQLGTIRSKNCFVLAATQGLDGITQRLGIIGSRAVVNHFNTSVLMRTREAETALFAFLGMGMRTLRLKPRKDREGEYGATQLFQPAEPQSTPIEVPVCPMGALGQLAPHQAYIMYSDGRRTESPVWFVPWFELEPATPTAPIPAIQDWYFSARHVEELMGWAGFRRRWTPEVIAAAHRMPHQQPAGMLEVARTFFSSRAAMVPHGLEQLPPSWLAALPGILWRLKKPEWTHLPYFIDQVKVEAGMLLLHFVQEQPHTDERLTVWDKLRIAVNASVYPSVWRPMSRRHRQELGRLYPELRPALSGNPPLME